MHYHILSEDSLFILTQVELMHWIFCEKIPHGALVQKDLGGKWQKLSEISEWIFFHSPGQDKVWMLLKKIHIDKESKTIFKQKGPYSTEQISLFLELGICSSKDFIWKEGFLEWRRLSLVPEFVTHPIDTIEDALTLQMRKYQFNKPKIIRYCSDNMFSYIDWAEISSKTDHFSVKDLKSNSN